MTVVYRLADGTVGEPTTENPIAEDLVVPELDGGGQETGDVSWEGDTPFVTVAGASRVFDPVSPSPLTVLGLLWAAWWVLK